MNCENPRGLCGKNPHPNWIVGGMPCAINIDESGAVGAVNMERLNWVAVDHYPHGGFH
ncbi:nickel-dependent hydrogenase large subunit [Escherichia coli]|uniref:nickel-dependent hydrogenase large subunit n=1 Tax=Escherichia coli TaxID=562 RepID=UPI00397EE81B